MPALTTLSLATLIQTFFRQHLIAVRGVSPHTLHAYRDAIRGLLKFAATRHQCSVVELALDHIGRDTVLAFLDHLEQQRGNAAVTRNARLAAIHSLYRFMAAEDPAALGVCHQVVAIPFKRVSRRRRATAGAAEDQRRNRPGGRQRIGMSACRTTGTENSPSYKFPPCWISFSAPAPAVIRERRKWRLSPPFKTVHRSDHRLWRARRNLIAFRLLCSGGTSRVYGFSEGAPDVAIDSAAQGQVTGLRSRRRRAEDLGPQRRKAMPPFALFPPLVPLDAASADSRSTPRITGSSSELPLPTGSE